jgi:hypothetical protein
VSLPLLLLLKEKKCLLIISMIMREHYFYDHERERESRVLHIKQTFNSLVAGHRIHVVAWWLSHQNLTVASSPFLLQAFFMHSITFFFMLVIMKLWKDFTWKTWKWIFHVLQSWIKIYGLDYRRNCSWKNKYLM